MQALINEYLHLTMTGNSPENDIRTRQVAESIDQLLATRGIQAFDNATILRLLHPSMNDTTSQLLRKNNYLVAIRAEQTKVNLIDILERDIYRRMQSNSNRECAECLIKVVEIVDSLLEEILKNDLTNTKIIIVKTLECYETINLVIPLTTHLLVKQQYLENILSSLLLTEKTIANDLQKKE